MDEQTRELFEAVKSGNAQRVGELLAADARLRTAIDEAGVSAILVAMYHGRPAIAELFRSEDRPLSIFEASVLGDVGRVRELADEINATGADGFQPLGLACFFGHEELAMFLVGAGADVHAASRNTMAVQPIHAAAARRSSTLVEVLLARGADPNARQQRGFTPLHAAAQHGDGVMVDLLLRAGADPALMSEEGKSAADYAQEAGHTELAARLRGDDVRVHHAS